ncbi:MAG: hypothetical protein H7281_13445 [Bacteriovorax sp.]|nr:hypothetical protein [Bacteriovorax sp.]
MAQWQIVLIIKRQKVLQFLNETVRPGVIDNPTIEVVQELADIGKNFLGSTQTSLISKYAFSMYPEIFFPYDSLVRNALKKRGWKIQDHDYCTYMKGFFQVKKELKTEIDKKCMIQPFYQNLTKLEKEIFINRVVDKYLWLEGDNLR